MTDEITGQTTITAIVGAAVKAFNARKFMQNGNMLSIKAEQLTGSGIYAITPPYSLYRRSAMALAMRGAVDAHSIAKTFNIAPDEAESLITATELALRNGDRKLTVAFEATASAANIRAPIKRRNIVDPEASAVPKQKEPPISVSNFQPRPGWRF
ncbi:MAG: hypothetical protein WC989_03655 [Micavibrio sp.]